MDRTSRILVLGGSGLVGSAIVRHLKGAGHRKVWYPHHGDLECERGREVIGEFSEYRPTHVFLAAAKVGGIAANAGTPGDFIRRNLLIQTNVINACRIVGAKLVFLGSSCIYPKHCPQPIREEYLMTGPLEPTNSAYAVAKIAGIEMVRAYHRQYGMEAVCLMPTNLYGPNDNFDPDSSHVLPAMIRKFHDAKINGAERVMLWGTGTPRREFLHVDDLADAAVFLMQNHDDPEPINVGCGEDLSIAALAETVADVVGYDGRIEWDASKPDGTPRKLLDVSKLAAMGWKPRIGLVEGIRQTYEWYCEHEAGQPTQTAA